MKRFLSMLLGLCMILICLSPNVRAAEVVKSGICGADLTWSLDSSGVLTISGTGKMWSWEEELVAPWDSYRSSIISAVIQEGVTTIGHYAFENCDALTAVCIPNSVTEIGYGAFSNCASLAAVTIPGGVTEIRGNTFTNCGLTDITIPESISSIGAYAFCGCNKLTQVTIPSSVTQIGSEAFGRCTGLQKITVAESNPVYCSDAFGVLLTKDRTQLLQAPGGITGSYTVAGSVTSIGNYAFYNCAGLSGITLGKAVANIGTKAFFGCSNLTGFTVALNNKSYSADASGVLFNKGRTQLLQAPGGITGAYTIPSSVTDIAERSFQDCTGLQLLSIPASVKSLGSYCFLNCDNLQHVAYGGTKTQWNNVKKGWNVLAWSIEICYEGEIISKNYCLGTDLFCTGCDTFLTTEHGPHSCTKAVTAPTLTTNGYTTFTCTVCGYSYVENYIFPDVPNTLWSYNAIEFAVAKGYFSGYKSGNFGPTDNITRQDFVIVLARIAGVDLNQYSGRTGFPDVVPGSYYEKAVKWASATGVVKGYQSGKFGVDDRITREQLVTILYRYAKMLGCDTSVSENAAGKLYQFGDSSQVTSYAKSALIWALDKGVIKGMTVSSVAPLSNASRGQVATMLMNISKNNLLTPPVEEDELPPLVIS